METPYEKRFNELVARMVRKLETVIVTKIYKSRNREKIVAEELEQLNHVFMYFFMFNSFVEKEIITFCENYSRGIPIDDQVNELILVKEKWNESKKNNIYNSEITSKYQLEEIDYYNQIRSPNYIIGCFARFISVYKIIKLLSVQYEEIQDKYQCLYQDINYKNQYNQYYYLTDEQLIKQPTKLIEKKIIKSLIIDNANPNIIKWTGENNDFYKLIYSLHKSKLLNNGDGDITKIVPIIASFLSIELSNSWQSSFSQHKNKNNNDYNHFELFDKLRESYKSILEKK